MFLRVALGATLMTEGDDFIATPWIPFPDPRMANFVGKVDKLGRASPMSPGHLQESAERWSLTKATPVGPAGLLRTGRGLYVYSYYVFEFLPVGVLLTLQAVELAIRLRLEDPHTTLHKLIQRAVQVAVISAEDAEILDAGRQIRNDFSHPQQQSVWTYGMAAPVFAKSHEIVAHLFPENVNK